MENSHEGKIYSIISAFINTINIKDMKILQNKYEINSDIFEEIEECLQKYFGEKVDISLAPADIAFSEKIRSKHYIYLYEMNQKDTLGAECILWADGKATELMLDVELHGDSLDLRYRGIRVP